MENQRHRISTIATSGRLKAKKNMLHQKLSNNCIPNTSKAVLRSWLGSCSKKRYKVKPINKYKTVHTGPNNQLGGSKTGLIKPGYQFWILSEIMKPAKPPTASGNNKHNISLGMFFIQWPK